jgi:membrane-bound lytic murein transglycosylase B
LTAVISTLFYASAAPAATDFGRCVGELQQKARQEGISGNVVDTALANVSFNKRVIELDRRQPEFTATFAGYLNRRVTEDKVRRGRDLLAEHRSLLRRITRRYGVPGHYLVAFWGIETHYGRYFGKMPVLDSLATLACDERRSAYFTNQLMAALHIVDAGDISAERMNGSWAGAMGNFQFMPSVFQRYTVDYDGDGRRDVWHDLPDAFASAANFLQALGWEKGTRWGREVRLPEGFPYHLAGIDNKRPLSEWRKLGIRDADGNALPRADLKAALLVPSGHRGPAFLVYHNFRVIMRWNRSQFYALAVGHLADRIAGAAPLRQPPPADLERLSRDTVKTLQQRLRERGFDAGEPDGIMGPLTRQAVRAFQRDRNMVADGYPGTEVFRALGMEIQASR